MCVSKGEGEVRMHYRVCMCTCKCVYVCDGTGVYACVCVSEKWGREGNEEMSGSIIKMKIVFKDTD